MRMAKETTAVGRHHTPLRPLRVTKMVSAEDGRKLNKTLLLQKLFKQGFKLMSIIYSPPS